MTSFRFRRVEPDKATALGSATLDDATLAAAGAIVRDVQKREESALREHAQRLGDLAPGAQLAYERVDLEAARDALPQDTRDLLERAADRIAAFARAQRNCLRELTTDVPGGQAGHTIRPVHTAGCYAPGGRYPLPSSVLMTAVTARTAGVQQVVVASPRPSNVTLASAAIAKADRFLAAGGAQAIAALAFGAGSIPPCDVVVGPGNRWVTAAKQIVAGRVAIDMLAGPSELVVLADSTGDPPRIAADLLAQAEHDADALPILVTWDLDLIARVEREIDAQLANLPTADVARLALHNGFAVPVATMSESIAVCDRLAPEHLSLHVRDAEQVMRQVRNYGAVFVGAQSGEVFGDYGLGPNHVLPTGGTSRAFGGLSVLTFLRVRTWLRLDDVAATTVHDVAALARLEGLEAHARSAEARTPAPAT